MEEGAEEGGSEEIKGLDGFDNRTSIDAEPEAGACENEVRSCRSGNRRGSSFVRFSSWICSSLDRAKGKLGVEFLRESWKDRGVE
ncbi:hypothetical protein L596_030597 [Steinernema carpocapsae]|uniref:Uncharacterized protein n=1 Tax=Steinernema carpocapsae TaxID=34508 RepID=A0A4U5LPV4_STECR|nr:hypothetical protein L596_030597 [Steinernema carpocapsae]